jgi:ubiquitin related modifier 1
MKVNIEFSGGLELMFESKKKIELNFEEKKEGEYQLRDIIEELRANHLKDREELFVQSGTVRPGIIVLVNDTDWELLGADEYVVEPNDTVTFISTLHGG